MRDAGWWAEIAPSTEALESTQPFAVDTLEFGQWLQFIFLPKMHHILRSEFSLPSSCGIAPMVEEYSKANGLEFGQVINILSSIDRLLTENR